MKLEQCRTSVVDRGIQDKTQKNCGTTSIVLTLDIWRNKKNEKLNPKTINEVVSLVEGKYFPCLDTCMFWDKELEELRFKVFIKPEQRLKYLDKGSNHPNSILHAIPWGFLN